MLSRWDDTNNKRIRKKHLKVIFRVQVCEFGRSMVRILARPNEPDLTPKGTKTVHLVFIIPKFGQGIMISQLYQVSSLISQISGQ